MFPIAVWLLSFLAPGVQRCGNHPIASNTVFKWSCIKVAFAVTVVFAPKLTTYYSWKKRNQKTWSNKQFWAITILSLQNTKASNGNWSFSGHPFPSTGWSNRCLVSAKTVPQLWVIVEEFDKVFTLKTVLDWFLDVGLDGKLRSLQEDHGWSCQSQGIWNICWRVGSIKSLTWHDHSWRRAPWFIALCSSSHSHVSGKWVLCGRWVLSPTMVSFHFHECWRKSRLHSIPRNLHQALTGPREEKDL